MSENVNIRRKRGRVCLLLAIALFAANANADDRLTVHLYQYSTPPADPVAEQYLGQFVRIIGRKVRNLGAELGRESETYRDLSLFPVDSDGATDNINQLESRWQTASALQLFLGRVRKADDAYAVRTQVYFGLLPTRIEGEFLDLDFLISGDEFESTRDSHSAVILYALALDGCLQSKPANEIIALLSKAKESLSDVADELMGVAELRAAIDAELAAGGSCGGEQT